jgi:hypothetical protein
MSTLKTLADVTDGARPRAVLERLAVKQLAGQLKSLNQETKEAARPASAIVLAIRAERAAGESFVGFEPQTIADMGFDPQEVERIMAAKLVLHATEPFTDWHIFLAVASTLNEYPADWDHPMDLTVAELAWAADAMRYMDPATPWGSEVAVYIARCLHEEGFVKAPSPLDFAQQALSARTSAEGRAVAQRMLHDGDDLACRVQRDRLMSTMNYVNTRHHRLVAELEKA